VGRCDGVTWRSVRSLRTWMSDDTRILRRLDDRSLKRVTFTTSVSVHAEPLAEFVILGVLAGAKNLDRLQAHQRRHEWVMPWAMGGVSEQRVVVFGLGNIGRAVAAKLDALGAEVTEPRPTHQTERMPLISGR
jgi:phosphoglycerate dehydrogenase-like enzyme